MIAKNTVCMESGHFIIMALSVHYGRPSRDIKIRERGRGRVKKHKGEYQYGGNLTNVIILSIL